MILATNFENDYKQFGKRVMVTKMDFSSLLSIFEIDWDLHRKIDSERILACRDWYVTCAKNNRAFHLAPFLFSARGKGKSTKDGWGLEQDAKLFILDGMHRVLGLVAALYYLTSKREEAEQQKKWKSVKRIEQAIERIQTFPIGLQIYLDLSLEEERKLFADLNTESREVHTGETVLYEQRNEWAILTRKVAEKFHHSMEIEQKLSRVTDQSSALTSLSIMHKCTLAMWEGHLEKNELQPSKPSLSIQSRERITEEFYKVWLELFPAQAENRSRYVTGLAGIQIALAYTVFLLTRDHHLTHRKAVHTLTTLKPSCTWKHDDPLFLHLFDHTSGRIKGHSKKSSIKATARQFIKRITEEGQG